MSRRSSRIKELTPADKRLLEQLSRTGVADRTQGNQQGVNDHRQDQLERSNFLSIEQHLVYGNQRDILVLSDAGKKWARENLPINQLYMRNNQQVEHDLRLTQMYLELPHINWKTESEFKNQLELETGQKPITGVDGTMEVTREQFIELMRQEDDRFTFKDLSMGQELPAICIIAVESIGETYSAGDRADKCTVSVQGNCQGIIMSERG